MGVLIEHSNNFLKLLLNHAEHLFKFLPELFQFKFNDTKSSVSSFKLSISVFLVLLKLFLGQILRASISLSQNNALVNRAC